MCSHKTTSSLEENANSFQLPEPVRLKALSQGDVGLHWLSDLPSLVHDLAERWRIMVGEPMSGGSEGLVLPAERADGSKAILKVGIPGISYLANEANVLRLADGRGYPALIAHDDAHNAILLERLGSPLAEQGKSEAQQIEIICQTLQEAWVPLAHDHGLLTGAEKARLLAKFIDETWRELGQPCLPATKDQVLAFAVEREAAYDPAHCVLVHGDAHAFNTLQQLQPVEAGSGYKFIDPDGLFAEPAFDLAIPMRDWSAELLAGDAVRLGQTRCQLLADLTGLEERAIWQWGSMERVSTGLYLMQIGLTKLGLESLAVADIWARADVRWAS